MNNLSNTLLAIFIAYNILALVFMAIDGGIKRFLDTFAFEKSTCIKVTHLLSSILSGILISIFFISTSWVLFTQLNDKSNIKEVGLILGFMFLIFFVSTVKFDILPGRRN
ncbi:MAG: hypothetical protein HFJ35_01635 [Clostridia bacterium]|nr:hypothetical protein [Clostridia bacterium]